MKTKLKTMLAIALTAGVLHAEDSKIKDIMKASMKGDTSLHKTVATGKGTPEDAKKLAESLNGLEGTKAPKGDQAAFEAKVSALVKAANDVIGGDKAALPALQKAGNCKACHGDHKPS